MFTKKGPGCEAWLKIEGQMGDDSNLCLEDVEDYYRHASLESGSLSRPDADQDDFDDTKMSLVDWRWAAEKGFWSRERHCWIDEAGGKAAFLQQRAMKRRKRPRHSEQGQSSKARTSNVQQVASAQRFSIIRSRA